MESFYIVKMNKNREFKKFLATTVADYIKEAMRQREIRGAKSTTWPSVFKNQQIDFDNTAKDTFIYEINIKPDENVTMEEFVERIYGKDKAELYAKFKNLDYTNPDGTNTFKPTENNYKALTKLIKPFIWRVPAGVNIDKPSAAERNTILFYNAIYDTDFGSLSEIAQELAIDKTQRDADKKHNQDMEALKLEKDKEKEEELMRNTREIKDAIHKDLAIKANNRKGFKDDNLKNDDIEEATEESASDEIAPEEPDRETDKAKKAAEKLEAKIKEDGIVTRAAIDSDFYKQLPEDIKQSLRPKIEEKKAIIERSKVIRYLLPKERPKWESVTMNTGVNPLLSRGAWGV